MAGPGFRDYIVVLRSSSRIWWIWGAGVLSGFVGFMNDVLGFSVMPDWASRVVWTLFILGVAAAPIYLLACQARDFRLIREETDRDPVLEYVRSRLGQYAMAACENARTQESYFDLLSNDGKVAALDIEHDDTRVRECLSRWGQDVLRWTGKDSQKSFRNLARQFQEKQVYEKWDLLADWLHAKAESLSIDDLDRVYLATERLNQPTRRIPDSRPS